jgi:hypothetical protein
MNRLNGNYEMYQFAARTAEEFLHHCISCITLVSFKLWRCRFEDKNFREN